MAKDYTIAEHSVHDEEGYEKYVVEYERPGNGVQRPTFKFPLGTSFTSATKQMTEEIERERKLNETVTRTKNLDGKNVGKKF